MAQLHRQAAESCAHALIPTSERTIVELMAQIHMDAIPEMRLCPAHVSLDSACTTNDPNTMDPSPCMSFAAGCVWIAESMYCGVGGGRVGDEQQAHGRHLGRAIGPEEGLQLLAAPLLQDGLQHIHRPPLLQLQHACAFASTSWTHEHVHGTDEDAWR